MFGSMSNYVRRNSEIATVLDERGRDPMTAAVTLPINDAPMRKPPKRMPIELMNRKDLVRAYLAGERYARTCYRRRQKVYATELVNDVFIKLCTTHRWDPAKLDLEAWFLLLVKNEIKERYHGDKGKLDPETAAQFRNYEITERFVECMPPDEVLIERQEREGAEARRAQAVADLDAIELATTRHAIASAVIAEMRVHGADLRPQQLADRLGVDVNQIYRAKEVIQYHARKLRGDQS